MADRNYNERPGYTRVPSSGTLNSSRSDGAQPRLNKAQQAAYERARQQAATERRTAAGTNSGTARVASNTKPLSARSSGTRRSMNQRNVSSRSASSAATAYRSSGGKGAAYADLYGGKARPIVQPPKKRKRGKIIAAIVIIILLALVAFGVYAGKAAFAAKDTAYTAVSQVKAVKSSLTSLDFTSAQEQSLELQDTAQTLKEQVNEPLWQFVGALPVVCDDVTYVQTLADALEDLTSNALVPLTTQAAGISPDTLKVDGKINLSALSGLSSSLVTIAPVLDRCTTQLQGLPSMHVGKIMDKVTPLVEQLSEANTLVQAVVPIAGIIPDLAGANGTRTYMIAAQNSAETRSTGGYLGSVGLLTVDNGSLDIGEFQAVRTVLDVTLDKYTYITDEENQIFGTWMTWAPNVGYNPDFTRVAQVWCDGYEYKNGVHLDGVISVTPSVLQDILAITGSVTLSDGTELNGDNATKILQSEIYWKYIAGDNIDSTSNSTVDTLFGEAAKKTFEQIKNHMSVKYLQSYMELAQSTFADRRVMIWLTNADEQQLISSYDISGGLNWDVTNPKIGTYFNCCSGSKMGWYADMKTDISDGAKNADGTTSYQVTTTLYNAITSEESNTGGLYITGMNGEKGNMYPYIYFVAPAGGSISDFTVSSGWGFNEAQFYDHQMIYLNAVNMPPSTSLVFTYTVTVSAQAQSSLGVISTPLLTQYR